MGVSTLHSDTIFGRNQLSCFLNDDLLGLGTQPTDSVPSELQGLGYIEKNSIFMFPISFNVIGRYLWN